MSPLEMLRAFARYETHGGYSWGMVCDDGELLCETCVRDNYRQVFRSTRDNLRAGWRCIGLANSGESESTEHCANCNLVLWEHERDDIVTATAPSVWASYLINGDASGLEDDEIAAVDAWVSRMGLGSPVDCTDAGFRWMHDAWNECPLGADCQTYTFLKRQP